MKITPKHFHQLSLALMSIGYLWLWCFNRNPHVLVKFMTMQAYFLAWLYFLLLTLKKNQIFGFSIERLFQLNFVLQLFVTPMYWALIHYPMVESRKFPQYEVNWNAYIHIIPMVLLIGEYAVMKRQFHNRWQDTAKFFYFFALPVNLLYSHLHFPVYQILKYDDIDDYLLIFVFGLMLIGLQFLCYYFFKNWNRKLKEMGKIQSKTELKQK